MKKMSIFAVAGDSLLTAACGFFIIFTAVRFYTKNSAAGLGLGLAAFALFGTLTFLRLWDKRGRAVDCGKAHGRKKAFKAYLCSLDEEGCAELIARATGAEHRGKRAYSEDREYIGIFRPAELSPNDMCGAIQNCTSIRRVIFCNGASEDAVEFCKLFGVQVESSDRLFEELEKMGGLPDLSFYPKAGKNILSAFKGALRRAKAGRLMWCGLGLTALSYFTFFPVYYIVSGGALLALAAACMIFGRRD